MKQIYFSEDLGRYFETAEECEKAEAEEREAKALAEQKKNEVSKQKKSMADEIAKCEQEVDSAYVNLETAYTQADKILKEAKEKSNKIIQEAKEKLQEAQKNKFDAVSKFNKQFGVYTTTYNGDKALKELQRANAWINDIFGGFFF